MHKHLLILLFLTCSYITVCAQDDSFIVADSVQAVAEPEEDEETAIEEIPDTTLFKKTFLISQDTISALKRRKAFSYIFSLDSLLKAKQTENMESEKNVNSSLSFLDRMLNSSFLKIIFWTVAVLVVLFILFRLFATEGVFRRASKDKQVEEKEEEEKIYTQSDYARLIQQSCRLGDYRSAVKYLFLRTLQQLSDHAHIEFAADKTNFRYLQEVPADKKRDFSRLILNYEYIWYGNQHIERNMYEKVEAEFTAFQQKI